MSQQQVGPIDQRKMDMIWRVLNSFLVWNALNVRTFLFDVLSLKNSNRSWAVPLTATLTRKSADRRVQYYDTRPWVLG